MRKGSIQIYLVLFLYLLAACSSSGPNPIPPSVEEQAIINLVCANVDQADCVKDVCPDADACPLFRALSNPAIFTFVETYSSCEGCNTPDLSPRQGIGKCIEYEVAQISSGWEVTFSVSGNCSFRYGSPGVSRITVGISADGKQIENIQPPVAYIKDPSYCQTDADCFCLSGSGVPLIGCSNLLYAPLNGSGYYAGNACGCESGQCVQQ